MPNQQRHIFAAGNSTSLPAKFYSARSAPPSAIATGADGSNLSLLEQNKVSTSEALAVIRPQPQPVKRKSSFSRVLPGVGSGSGTSVGGKKLNGIPVEYWNSSVGRWTGNASISVSKNRAKLHLDVLTTPGSAPTASGITSRTSGTAATANTRSGVDLNTTIQGEERRIKFNLDSSLRVEHTVPFAKDFQITFSGGGELVRHRVATFTEDEGLSLLKFFERRGVQILRRRGGVALRRPSSILQKKPLRPISEGEIIGNLTGSITSLRSLSFKTQNQDETDSSSTSLSKSNNMTHHSRNQLLRRKSTGSFDVNQKTRQAQPKHSEEFDRNSPRNLNLSRRNSLSYRSKKGTQAPRTTWYNNTDSKESSDADEFYGEAELKRFDSNMSKNNKNSRQSLETDEESSSDPGDLEESYHPQDSPDGRFLSKLFHSTPTLNRRNKEKIPSGNRSQIRPRAPTNENLEKYKFLLVNIEPDADILNPGTFPLQFEDGGDENNSYIGFDFNDYPAEVFCQPEESSPKEASPSSSVTVSRSSSLWIRRSFEELASVEDNKNKVLGLNLSKSTGNLDCLVGKGETESKAGDFTSDEEVELNHAKSTEKLSPISTSQVAKNNSQSENMRRLLASGSPTLTECL